jgi:hypothetical protein
LLLLQPLVLRDIPHWQRLLRLQLRLQPLWWLVQLLCQRPWSLLLDPMVMQVQ